MSKRKRKPNSVIPVIPFTNPKSSQRRRISGSTHNTTQHNTKNTNETDTKVTKHKHNGLKKRWTYHKGNPHPQSYASQTASKQKEYPQYWVVEGEKGRSLQQMQNYLRNELRVWLVESLMLIAKSKWST
eukprot:490140_1